MNNNTIFSKFEYLPPIIAAIESHGATCYVVGGAVRDLIMHQEITDLDIEVHDISLEKLKMILEGFGTVLEVGAFFGVLKLAEHAKIDWSLPRTDSAGRKPHVAIDEHMDITKALRRRDVTMNAMALAVTENKIIDPFGGQQDIQKKILRAVDKELFVQDPLRFFRVMHFIGRFAMQPDAQLSHICKTMDITQISRERIEAEFEKLFLRSQRPSLGIRWLQEIDRLRDVLPELHDTVGIEQNPQWHPEGDVFEHTMQTLDATAIYRTDDKIQNIIRCWAVISHDLGKVTTTNLKEGKIVSYLHEIEGVPLARQMIQRISNNKELLAAVSRLVRYHMMPGMLVKQHAKAYAYKKLALALEPVTNCYELSLVAFCDRAGRNGNSQLPLAQVDPDIMQFQNIVKDFGILYGPEKPILTGKDFLPYVEPGPELGKLVDLAYTVQIKHNIKDYDHLLEWALSGKAPKKNKNKQ